MKLKSVERDPIETIIYRYEIELEDGTIIKDSFEENTWHLSDEEILERILKIRRKAGLIC